MWKRNLTMTLLALAVSTVLAAQRRQPEVIAPMVDEKYGSSGDISARGPDELVMILNDPEGSLYAKAKACQKLAVVGDADSVPALEALLTDPKLSHYARFALEAIPDPSVDEALLRTLEKVEGKLLIGVINSIGRRKDPDAAQALGALLHDSDREVAASAAVALRRIRPAFY
jgi:HEAT repeat protein